MTIEIKVKNTKATPVNIKVEDQIPITKNDKIEIKAIELNGAALDEDTGGLTWLLNLKPNETKKIIFTYSVTYEKGKQVFMQN
jgi:hypothetical protein